MQGDGPLADANKLIVGGPMIRRKGRKGVELCRIACGL